jgi:hypothetical protein
VFDSKNSADLDVRTLEKLSIHRLYCGYKGWAHYIVTETAFSPRVRRNLAWVRGGRRKDLEVVTPPGLFDIYPALMMNELRSRKRHLSLINFGTWFEHQHHLDVGIGLRILKILAWRREIFVDPHGAEISETSTGNLLRAPRAAKALRQAV